MATQYGIPINFGFKTTTNGITTSISSDGLLLQSFEHSKQANVLEIFDADGDVANTTFFNFHDEATLECVITGADMAGAITNSALQTPGTLITITAGTSVPSLVHASEKWQIQPGYKITGTNQNAKTVTVPIKKFSGIQAAAS